MTTQYHFSPRHSDCGQQQLASTQTNSTADNTTNQDYDESIITLQSVNTPLNMMQMSLDKDWWRNITADWESSHAKPVKLAFQMEEDSDFIKKEKQMGQQWLHRSSLKVKFFNNTSKRLCFPCSSCCEELWELQWELCELLCCCWVHFKEMDDILDTLLCIDDGNYFVLGIYKDGWACYRGCGGSYCRCQERFEKGLKKVDVHFLGCHNEKYGYPKDVVALIYCFVKIYWYSIHLRIWSLYEQAVN